MSRALPLVVLIAITVFAVIDAILTPREQLPSKTWWVLGIVLVPLVGPVAWLTVGRRARRDSGGGGNGGSKQPPVAPDDDPDFLRGL
jgi:hypothetical protein